MNRTNTMEAIPANITAMLDNMPPVDVEKLRAEYRAKHADEIAAHEKYMTVMRAVCQIFEK